MAKISIITPCFNEELNIVRCIESIRNVMELCGVSYEHIISDNNSTDLTWNNLKEQAKSDSRIKIIRNVTNVGPTRNTWNALKYASGDAVIPFVPADLQDPPEKIPELIAKWNEGFDVVFGIRAIRKEFIFIRVARRVFYFLYSKIVDNQIPKNAGEFLIADKTVIDRVLEEDEIKPYIRGLISMNATNVSTVSYIWNKRQFGKSKNGFWQLFDEAVNALTSTSIKLGKLVLVSGLLASISTLIFAIASVVWFVATPTSTPKGIPLLIVLFLLVSSYQILLLGIVGEYVLNIKSRLVRNKKVSVAEKFNF